jgi:hypothetical protein
MSWPRVKVGSHCDLSYNPFIDVESNWKTPVLGPLSRPRCLEQSPRLSAVI